MPGSCLIELADLEPCFPTFWLAHRVPSRTHVGHTQKSSNRLSYPIVAALWPSLSSSRFSAPVKDPFKSLTFLDIKFVPFWTFGPHLTTGHHAPKGTRAFYSGPSLAIIHPESSSTCLSVSRAHRLPFLVPSLSISVMKLQGKPITKVAQHWIWSCNRVAALGYLLVSGFSARSWTGEVLLPGLWTSAAAGSRVHVP